MKFAFSASKQYKINPIYLEKYCNTLNKNILY
jgi:hypothetical protein